MPRLSLKLLYQKIILFQPSGQYCQSQTSSPPLSAFPLLSSSLFMLSLVFFLSVFQSLFLYTHVCVYVCACMHVHTHKPMLEKGVNRRRKIKPTNFFYCTKGFNASISCRHHQEGQVTLPPLPKIFHIRILQRNMQEI